MSMCRAPKLESLSRWGASIRRRRGHCGGLRSLGDISPSGWLALAWRGLGLGAGRMPAARYELVSFMADVG